MGLSRDFLQMLTAFVVVERKTGVDSFGNDTYGSPSTERSFINSSDFDFPADTQGQRKEKNPSGTTTLIMDAIGIKLGDKITWDTNVPHWVVKVVTAKDALGADLYHDVTATTTKRG